VVKGEELDAVAGCVAGCVVGCGAETGIKATGAAAAAGERTAASGAAPPAGVVALPSGQLSGGAAIKAGDIMGLRMGQSSLLVVVGDATTGTDGRRFAMGQSSSALVSYMVLGEALGISVMRSGGTTGDSGTTGAAVDCGETT
jgi:hypothetical protein